MYTYLLAILLCNVTVRTSALCFTVFYYLFSLWTSQISLLEINEITKVCNSKITLHRT